MTSASYFESHDDPHVLPIDGDPSDLDDTIPLDEYDYSAETAELADRINATADGGHDQPPTDDEGDEADGDDQNTHDDDEQGNESANLRSASTRPASEPASSERSDSDGQEVENRFDCPRCGVEHVGYPAGCDECSAVYNW